jgi:hypothetical protein
LYGIPIIIFYYAIDCALDGVIFVKLFSHFFMQINLIHNLLRFFSLRGRWRGLLLRT